MSQNTPQRTVNITATLTDDAGNPLSNKTINFYMKPHNETSWSQIGSASTDANGNASISTNVPAPGIYDFKAEFPGDSQYESSSAEQDGVTVKAKTVLSITVQVV